MMTYSDVAKDLGVSERTVKGWAMSRQLTVVRTGHRTVRIREADYEAFLNRRTKKAR